jgi:HEPN domain-containing protein
VLSRYPGLSEPVTREEYESALEIAEQIVEWAEDQIQRRDQLPN